jgi:hypothetical protein
VLKDWKDEFGVVGEGFFSNLAKKYDWDDF